MKNHMLPSGLLAVFILGSSAPAYGQSSDRSRCCCETMDRKETQWRLLDVSQGESVNWELLRQSEVWDRVSLGPPLPHEIFPDPHRDPRLGSLSRDPITLRYWWE